MLNDIYDGSAGQEMSGDAEQIDSVMNVNAPLSKQLSEDGNIITLSIDTEEPLCVDNNKLSLKQGSSLETNSNGELDVKIAATGGLQKDAGGSLEVKTLANGGIGKDETSGALKLLLNAMFEFIGTNLSLKKGETNMIGGVKSSDENNKLKILEDGTAIINGGGGGIDGYITLSPATVKTVNYGNVINDGIHAFTTENKSITGQVIKVTNGQKVSIVVPPELSYDEKRIILDCRGLDPYSFLIGLDIISSPCYGCDIFIICDAPNTLELIDSQYDVGTQTMFGYVAWVSSAARIITGGGYPIPSGGVYSASSPIVSSGITPEPSTEIESNSTKGANKYTVRPFISNEGSRTPITSCRMYPVVMRSIV